jgi:flagellar assembly factor FliW
MPELQMTMSNDTSGLLASSTMDSDVMSEGRTIQTRFGEVTLSLHDTLTLSRGLLGFPNLSRYCVLDFPLPKFSKFRLLQSIEEEQTSFIVLPLEPAQLRTLIDMADLEAAMQELDISSEYLRTLLVVSVHRYENYVRLSVNVRAPILIHAQLGKATQFVFGNSKYSIQHFISGELSDRL